MRKLHAIFIVFLLFGITSELRADELKPIRWAIIAPASVGDLLTVELSQQENLELVERAEVDKAMKELELSALLQQHSLQQGVKLGRVLKADRLLVISPKPLPKASETEQPVHAGNSSRLLILDTRYGVVLFQSDLDIPGDSLESVLPGIVKIVTSIHARYRHGVEGIVAVSYFLTKNFERSYDHYQEDFAHLISESLLQRDGIAVVALEELAAIQKEIAFTGDNTVAARIVPLSITGEYTVVEQKGKEPLFTISLAIKNGEKTLASPEKKEISLREASSFLAVSVPEQVLKMLDGNASAPISLEAQKRRFKENADLLMGVGAAELALRNREAIFLLDSDDLENTMEMLLGNGRIRNRYRALPYLESLLREKKVSFFYGSQIVHLVLNATTGPIQFGGHENKPLNEAEDPLNLSDDLDVLIRLVPLILELPESAPRFEALLLTRKPHQWNYFKNYGDQVIPRHQQNADFLSVIQNHIDGQSCAFDGYNAPQPQWMEYRSSSNEQMEKIFKLGRLLPKEMILQNQSIYMDSIGFQSGQYVHGEYMSYVARDPWMHFCNLWRATKDEDFILLADLMELNWMARNRNKLAQGEWETKAVPMFKRISEKYWKKIDDNTFVPIREEQKYVLDFIAGLAVRTGVSKDVLRYVRMETQDEVVFQVRRHLKDPNENAPRPYSPYFAENYLQIGTHISWPSEEDRYLHVKNSRVSLVPIEDWDFPIVWKGVWREELPPHQEQLKKFWEYMAKQELFHGMESSITPCFEVENLPTFLEKLDDTTDILWDRCRIFRVTAGKDGKLQYVRLYTVENRPYKWGEDQGFIRSLRCDGRNIWVSFSGGVSVLDREGKPIVRFDSSDGLPEIKSDTTLMQTGKLPEGRTGDGFRETQWNRDNRDCWNETQRIMRDGISVFPTAPGEALVLGKTGPLQQTWLGVLRFDAASGEKSVKILLKTTRNLPAEQYENEQFINAKEQWDVIFNFPWICRFNDSRNPQRRQVLVAREFGFSLFTSPFLIDMENEQIMLLNERYPDLSPLKGAVAIECVNDVFVLRRGSRMIEIFARDEKGEYRRAETLDPANRRKLDYGASMDCHLFTIGDSVYAPGSNWYRIDTAESNPKAELIGDCDSTVPPFYRLRNYASSAHFGIWVQPQRGTPWSLTETPRDIHLSAFWKYVPAEKLEKHDAAVKKLTSLGAKVQYGTTYRRFFYRDDKWNEGFSVTITPNWKGSDGDLSALNDIDRLCAVAIVKANVSDEGLKIISEIPTVCELFLLQTNVSTQGLAEYPLDRLTRLYLEDSVDKTVFTDATLELLKGKRHLKVLGFAGRGFTDRSCQIIETIPDLRSVYHSYPDDSKEAWKRIDENLRQRKRRPPKDAFLLSLD